ncbi:MAG: acylphosphatase [Chromatiales bacterium]|nr:acylphosphatase [Chromatiales bacterium]
MNDPWVARRFLVSGKVQGVFFRASTARMAEQLGLRGYARNLPDGRVEVLAVGVTTSVDALAGWLGQGPPRAKVTAVVAHDQAVEPYARLSDFRTG